MFLIFCLLGLFNPDLKLKVKGSFKSYCYDVQYVTVSIFTKIRDFIKCVCNYIWNCLKNICNSIKDAISRMKSIPSYIKHQKSKKSIKQEEVHDSNSNEEITESQSDDANNQPQENKDSIETEVPSTTIEAEEKKEL